jgi:hypothetical protein
MTMVASIDAFCLGCGFRGSYGMINPQWAVIEPDYSLGSTFLPFLDWLREAAGSWRSAL